MPSSFPPPRRRSPFGARPSRLSDAEVAVQLKRSLEALQRLNGRLEQAKALLESQISV